MKERSSWCYTRCSSCFYSPKARQEDREILYLAIDQHLVILGNFGGQF